MGVVTTRGLHKKYGRRTAVESMDLDVAQGQIFGFLGPNGAGKTTVIRVLMGFLRATAGGATIFGLDCWRDSPRIKHNIGYLPGDLNFYSWMTARRALQISSLVRRRDVIPTGQEIADRMSLDLDLSVEKMSRGTRQKLGIVLAMAHQPDLLLLDEPTTGLDPLMQDALCDRLRELAAEGATVFFSSHTLSEVEQLCDRVAIVREGSLVADESLDALRERAPRTVVLTYDSDEAAGAAKLPDFVVGTSRNRRMVTGELKGPATQLIDWAAGQPLTDISISPPNLQSLFRGYYAAPSESKS